jgi:FAD/FMN-containing dehydrogenase
LDRTFLDVAASEGAVRQVPAETESALLAEVEGQDATQAELAAREIEKIFVECGAIAARVALDMPTKTELWELRHAASPILARLDPRLRSMQFIEDGAVPPEKLPEYVRGVREILSENETRVVIFGHAGDSHVHVNPLVDVSRTAWRERVERMLRETVALTARLGGTLSGEHGDGRLRTPFLRDVWPAESLERFREVKAAFDPNGILNPGVKVPQENGASPAAVKYDPSLARPSRTASAVLERIERERAYARFRLEMLDEVQ